MQLVEADTDRLQHAFDHSLVVSSTVTENTPRRLHVIQIGVQVRKENSNLGACVEHVGDFDYGNKVGNVRLAGGSSAPVHLERSLALEDRL